MTRAAFFLILVLASYGAAIWFYQVNGPHNDCPPHEAANPWCVR